MGWENGEAEGCVGEDRPHGLPREVDGLLGLRQDGVAITAPKAIGVHTGAGGPARFQAGQGLHGDGDSEVQGRGVDVSPSSELRSAAKPPPLEPTSPGFGCSALVARLWLGFLLPRVHLDDLPSWKGEFQSAVLFEGDAK